MYKAGKDKVRMENMMLQYNHFHDLPLAECPDSLPSKGGAGGASTLRIFHRLYKGTMECSTNEMRLQVSQTLKRCCDGGDRVTIGQDDHVWEGTSLMH
jgi:hypothetical protein